MESECAVWESPFLSTPSARRATCLHLAMLLTALYFYPRPPRGGRHHGVGVCRLGVSISIHALREEGDSGTTGTSRLLWHFYPRPPRGGRQRTGAVRSGCVDFYPRPPRGGRRPGRAVRCAPQHFYPRPPRGGRLVPLKLGIAGALYFYPRPPRGGRPALWPMAHPTYSISIHALREEGDGTLPGAPSFAEYFYPRPPRGGRPFRASGGEK